MRAIQKSPSWWEGAEQQGFTLYASKLLNAPVRVDDYVTEREAQIIQRRIDTLATLDGIRAAKSNGAIRRALIVGLGNRSAGVCNR